MSEPFERMLDKILRYKPPPKGKKAEREKTKKEKKVKTKK